LELAVSSSTIILWDISAISLSIGDGFSRCRESLVIAYTCPGVGWVLAGSDFFIILYIKMF
jgi:hypothetical protein